MAADLVEDTAITVVFPSDFGRVPGGVGWREMGRETAAAQVRGWFGSPISCRAEQKPGLESQAGPARCPPGSWTYYKKEEKTSFAGSWQTLFSHQLSPQGAFIWLVPSLLSRV